jgi:hypothetical protein
VITSTALLDKMIAQVKALFEREQVTKQDDPEAALTDVCAQVVQQVRGLGLPELHELLEECRQRFPHNLHQAFDLWLSAGSPWSYEYNHLAEVVLGSALSYELETELLHKVDENKVPIAPTIRLAIVIDEMRIPAELRSEFQSSNIVQELSEMPWPRLPLAGEVYMGPGGYGYYVESVYFYANGVVTLYLRLDDVLTDETYVRALHCARVEGYSDWE